jgi:hypothetical protein
MAGRPIPNPQCGMRRMYQLGCRCPACLEANRVYQRWYREQLERTDLADNRTPVLT